MAPKHLAQVEDNSRYLGTQVNCVASLLDQRQRRESSWWTEISPIRILSCGVLKENGEFRDGEVTGYDQ